MLTVGVSEAVRHPQALLRRALAGDIPPMPVPRTAAELEPALRTAPESPRHELRERGRHVYNHVMNGINHMIPFVTGGGILIDAALDCPRECSLPDFWQRHFPGLAAGGDWQHCV